MTPAPACRACGAALTHTFLDLGMQPLANALIAPGKGKTKERTYPLHIRVCDRCLLVQAGAVADPKEIFRDYAYFSSVSETWLAHAKAYADGAVERLSLGPASRVVEIASNDGYLLQYFIAHGVPSLGIEPAANVAAVALERGVPTDIAFFSAQTAARLAARGDMADLIIANNVLAHVPDIGDFLKGVRLLLKPDGVFTAEFPHLLNLLREVQFDTLYHEHFSCLSLHALAAIAARQGLTLFDVEALPTHGGSLRLHAAHAGARPPGPSVAKVLAREREAGLDGPQGYDGFAPRVAKVCDGLKAFIAQAKSDGRTIVAYGAAAKGATLLNACGLTAASIPFVADKSPAKQGKLLPGSRIPIRPVEALDEARPDYVLILPWNLREEIIGQLPQVQGWGGRFVSAIPEIRIWPDAH